MFMLNLILVSLRIGLTELLFKTKLEGSSMTKVHEGHESKQGELHTKFVDFTELYLLRKVVTPLVPSSLCVSQHSNLCESVYSRDNMERCIQQYG